jgi:uncharacterized protein (TIGR02246 family)
MKRILATAALVLTTGCGNTAETHAPSAEAPSFSASAVGQMEGIDALVAAQGAAWSAKDAVAYGDTYTMDSEVVNPVGAIINGRAGVTAIHAFLFNPGAGLFRNSTLSLSVRSVTFLTGTTALVKLDGVLTGLSGLPPGLVETEPDTVRTRVSWIAVKQGQQWRIQYQQMTAVAPAP